MTLLTPLWGVLLSTSAGPGQTCLIDDSWPRKRLPGSEKNKFISLIQSTYIGRLCYITPCDGLRIDEITCLLTAYTHYIRSVCFLLWGFGVHYPGAPSPDYTILLSHSFDLDLFNFCMSSGVFLLHCQPTTLPNIPTCIWFLTSSIASMSSWWSAPIHSWLDLALSPDLGPPMGSLRTCLNEEPWLSTLIPLAKAS